MANYSGTTGSVLISASNVHDVTKWTFNTTAETSPFGSNMSGGFKKRLPGTKDGTGTIEGKYNSASPIEDSLREGTSVTLTLQRMSGKTYSVPAVIESLELEVDIDTGAPQSWVANFGSNGAWTEPS